MRCIKLVATKFDDFNNFFYQQVIFWSLEPFVAFLSSLKSPQINSKIMTTNTEILTLGYILINVGIYHLLTNLFLEKVCTILSNPLNGVVSCSNSNKLLSNCSYQCNIGFYRSGPPSTICNEDSSSNTGASWSEDAPQCLRKHFLLSFKSLAKILYLKKSTNLTKTINIC